MRKRLMLFSVLLLCSITAMNSAIRFVSTAGRGLKNGTSWTNASNDLQAMINASAVGDEVWVAMGTYHPTHSADSWTESNPTGVNSNLKDQRNAFVLKSGVKVYGGFYGWETNLAQRQWINAKTILSGDFNNNDYGNNSSDALSLENAHHVVISVDSQEGTILDGFSIQGGSCYRNDYEISNVTVNGIIVDARNGGGIYAVNSSVTLRNLEIRRNAALMFGAGIYCLHSSGLRGYNLYIYKNFGSYGGGISVIECDPKFKNSIITANEAGHGGGVYNAGTFKFVEGNIYPVTVQCYPQYTNVVIHSNLGSPTNGAGAGMSNLRCAPTITNSTIIGNYGGIYAAGICNLEYDNYPVINNSIIWNNKLTNGTISSIQDVYNSGITTYNHSLVQGLNLTASGGLDATAPGFDPKFMFTPRYAWGEEREMGSFTLSDDSPCIDAGNDSLYLASLSAEFGGWDSEYCLSLPPRQLPYDDQRKNEFKEFMWEWYYDDGQGHKFSDRYSGKDIPRLAGNSIDIGAAEVFFDVPWLIEHVHCATAWESWEPYRPNIGDYVELYVRTTSSEKYPVKIGLFHPETEELLADMPFSEYYSYYSCQIPPVVTGDLILSPYYLDDNGIPMPVRRTEDMPQLVERMHLYVQNYWALPSTMHVDLDPHWNEQSKHMAIMKFAYGNEPHDGNPFPKCENPYNIGEGDGVDIKTPNEFKNIAIVGTSSGFGDGSPQFSFCHHDLGDPSEGRLSHWNYMPDRNYLYRHMGYNDNFVIMPYISFTPYNGYYDFLSGSIANTPKTQGKFIVDRILFHLRDAEENEKWYNLKNATSESGINSVLSDTEDIKQIDVYSVLGKKIMSIPAGQNLDTSVLLPNTYIIKVTTGEETKSYKILKR